MKKAIIISGLILASLVNISCSTDDSDVFTTPLENVALLENIKTIEVEVLELINNHRVSKNLPALLKNEHIRTQTSNHTKYMIDNSSASHDNFFKRKEYLTTHIGAKKVSENVAYGYSNAESVVNAWLKSDSHKLNIEGNYTHFNITAEKDEKGRWFFTNIFTTTSL
ncbi:Cysteine-rich secretory protein family protein [Flaviramulus basaltis]|uniref:Cysteine-rich secretory protein family protein n=1 Tax=Flaviramulus basaltis TaxID=369401 RepID=A0A1K2IRT0_9FLAO|nr:CAP domain-containing protein [Flaviramulus basaltis]SFZ95137.1 Cysteine-rich secretory protein family protein [Flaviramulus basaltis]